MPGPALDILLSLAAPAAFLVPWRLTRGDPTERLARSAALALAWVQLGATALLFLGGLTPGPLLAWLGLGVALARPWRERPAAPAALGGLLALGPILAMASVPPWYRDELVYHLSLPQHFAAAGAYVQPDDNVFRAFPMGWESIVSAWMVLGGPNPRLLGAWTVAATALGVAALARRAGASPAAAGAAAATFLVVPTVAEFGASAYVEPWLCLLVAMALLDVLDDRWTAGLWAGLAASVKYPGLAVALFVVVLLPRGARPRAVLAAASLGAPFYVRNWIERGNPVFPLAYEVFGGEGWDAVRAWGYAVTLRDYGAGQAPLDWLLLLPRLLTSRALHQGFEGSVGPFVLVGLALVRRQPRLAAWVLLWTAWWALTVQQVRFWMPALAVLIALGAARAPRLLLVGTLAWGLGGLGELWRFQRTGDWLLGRVERDALLDQLLPESHRPYRELPELVPEDGRVWLVWMRAYTYDFPRAYRVDQVFEAWRLEELLDAAEGPADAGRRLAGFTHLLVNHRFFLVGENADWDDPGRTERLRARWAALVQAGVVREARSWGPVTLWSVHPP